MDSVHNSVHPRYRVVDARYPRSSSPLIQMPIKDYFSLLMQDMALDAASHELLESRLSI